MRGASSDARVYADAKAGRSTSGFGVPGALHFGAVVPSAFQSARVLRALNVVAVGSALAALVSAVGTVLTVPGLLVGLPTLAVGLIWALVLRMRATVGRSSVRWGWLASLPLAMLNAAVACAALLADSEPVSVVKLALAAIVGITFGAMIWIPALLFTLLCFGAPIAWAQRLAKKGLAGEERGERFVGITSVALALLALLVSYGLGTQSYGTAGLTHGTWFLRAVAILGALSGGAAALLAHAREATRRGFVARVERGDERGFRVDASAEGKVLVRVSSQGEGYRVADFHEEVFLLDEEGRATKARELALRER